MRIINNIYCFDTLVSTNLYLKENSDQYQTGDVVVARTQTGGYGTQGRHWSSAKDKGLYFSILIKHRLDGNKSSQLTSVMASAVYEVLRSLGLSTEIKLPNDILVENKKISGVLTETIQKNSMYISIIGVGINLNQSEEDFDLQDSRNTPTSLKLELGYSPSYNDILSLALKTIDNKLYEFLYH